MAAKVKAIHHAKLISDNELNIEQWKKLDGKKERVHQGLLAKLPKKFRKIIVLRHLEGKTLKEIAEITGWDYSKVCKMHSDAKSRLITIRNKDKIKKGEIVMEKGKCILCVALNKIAGITDESKAEDAYYSAGFGKGNCYNKYNKLKIKANKIGIKIGPKDYVDLAVLFAEKLGNKRSYMNKEALIELRGLINETDVSPEVWKYLQSLSLTKSKTAGLTKQKTALVPVQIATTGDGKIITINLTLNIHLHKE